MGPDDERVHEGGDAACWIDRACPMCGYLEDGEPPEVCPRCGSGTPSPAGADDPPAGGDTGTSGVARGPEGPPGS